MNPAELKARLQANLAVAGVKSSDPGPVAATAQGEKPQITPEASGNAPELLKVSQAPTEQQVPPRTSPGEQEPPAAPQIQSFAAQTETQTPRDQQAPVNTIPFAHQEPDTSKNPENSEPENSLADIKANPTAPRANQNQIRPATPTSRALSAESVVANPSALTRSDSQAQPALVVSAKTLAPHTEISVADRSSKTISESRSHLSSSAQPLQDKNPRTIAETETLRDKQNVSSISSIQTFEAKGLAKPPSVDGDFAGEPSASGGKNLGSTVDSDWQNETEKITARTAEPRTELASAQPVTPARKRALATPPTVAKRTDRTVLHRRDQGAVLRGYRIPVDLHRKAERAKLGLAARRGSSLFWDELLQGAIDLLLDDIHRISAELSAARRSPEMGTPSTRVLQAAIRHDQDLRLRMLRIDLEEIDGATVRLEEIWTWLIRQVVKNEG